jgi:hypothetical protein
MESFSSPVLVFVAVAVAIGSWLQLGNPRLIVEVSFKAASQMCYYKVTFGRSVIPEKVWLATSFEHGSVPIIFCQPYPLKQFAQEVLMEKLHALRDVEDRLVCSTYANAKMFVDALRRPAVPKQEPKECSIDQYASSSHRCNLEPFYRVF